MELILFYGTRHEFPCHSVSEGSTAVISVISIENFSDVFRTFGGSFLAAWKATIARVGAFCSVFQKVHGYIQMYDFAMESEEFRRPSHQLSTCRQNFLCIRKILLHSASPRC